MRVAVAGKGGAGKTTVSATLARLHARSGRDVVAVDADANPNLGAALGLRPEQLTALRPLPAEVVSRRFGGPGLTVAVEDLLDRFGVRAPDGVRLVLMGGPTHAGEGCLCSAHAAVSATLEDLGPPSESSVVVDMEASPEHFSRGTVRHSDVVVLVAEPYYRSLETVRRMAALGRDLGLPRLVVAANKVRTSDDAAAVREFCERHGLTLAVTVPWSDAVSAADRGRIPVIDADGTREVVAAVRALDEVLASVSGTGAGGRPAPVDA